MIQIQVSEFSRESQEFTLDLCETEEQLRLLTVRDLKEKISSKTGIDKDRLRVIKNGRTLGDDNCSLSEYGFTHETIIDYFEHLNPGRIQLICKYLPGKTLCIWLDDLDQTVLDFKYHIEDSLGIPPDEQRLIYKGKQLGDDLLLSKYGLCDMDTVHVMRKLRGGWQPAENSGNMGDRDGKNASMDVLADFDKPKPSRCSIS